MNLKDACWLRYVSGGCALWRHAFEACEAAQRRASTIRTHGVCPKIEYDLHQRRRILGDPQVATNKILAKYRNKPAGLP